MPRNEHDERWQREYDRAHFTTVSCRIPRAQADELKEACKALNTTMHAVLKNAIADCIEQAKGSR